MEEEPHSGLRRTASEEMLVRAFDGVVDSDE